jgi:hypothetical protein
MHPAIRRTMVLGFTAAALTVGAATAASASTVPGAPHSSVAAENSGPVRVLDTRSFTGLGSGNTADQAISGAFNDARQQAFLAGYNFNCVQSNISVTEIADNFFTASLTLTCSNTP